MKTILVDAIGAFVSEGKGIYKPLYGLLEEYQNRKIVLTMAPDNLMEKWGLNDLPYEVHTSKLNPKKSDPEYYRQVMEKFDLKANKTLCFEHDEAAAESARSVGITTHFYDSEKKDLSALKFFLDSSL